MPLSVIPLVLQDGDGAVGARTTAQLQAVERELAEGACEAGVHGGGDPRDGAQGGAGRGRLER